MVKFTPNLTFGVNFPIFVFSLTLHVTKVTKFVNIMAIDKKYYSFTPGLELLSKLDYSKIQGEIIDFLGCSKQDYYRKRACYINIPAHIKEGIELIFKKYNVNDISSIWKISDSDK